MNYLAHIIRAIKPRYAHLLLLGLLLPISTTQVTSLEKNPTTQHHTPQGLLPKEYILQNPLVALLTVSDYKQAKPKISSLPLVIKDEDLLKTIFQDHYGYHTLTPCKEFNYAVGRKKFISILRNISEELEQEKNTTASSWYTMAMASLAPLCSVMANTIQWKKSVLHLITKA